MPTFKEHCPGVAGRIEDAMKAEKDELDAIDAVMGVLRRAMPKDNQRVLDLIEPKVTEICLLEGRDTATLFATLDHYARHFTDQSHPTVAK